MTDNDWRAVLGDIVALRAWRDAWRLCQISPPCWSKRLLDLLVDADWRPEETDHATNLAALSALAIPLSDPAPRFGTPPLQSFIIQGRTLDASTVVMPPPPSDHPVADTADGRVQARAYEREVELCELPNVTRRTRFDAGYHVLALAFSPDGRWLAVGGRASQGPYLTLHTASDGTCHKTLLTAPPWSPAPRRPGPIYCEEPEYYDDRSPESPPVHRVDSLCFSTIGDALLACGTKHWVFSQPEGEGTSMVLESGSCVLPNSINGAPRRLANIGRCGFLRDGTGLLADGNIVEGWGNYKPRYVGTYWPASAPRLVGERLVVLHAADYEREQRRTDLTEAERGWLKFVAALFEHYNRHVATLDPTPIRLGTRVVALRNGAGQWLPELATLNAATTFEWLAPKLEAIARKPTTEAPDAMGSRMTPRESLMRVAGNLRDAAVSLRTGKDRQGALMRPDEVGKGLLRLWRVCDQADWSLPIAATYNACFQEIVDCLNRMKVEAEGLAGCS